MIRLIAHRGNIAGPKPLEENSPELLSKVMGDGYDVEVDLRLCDGEFKLGHDEPTYSIDSYFLKSFSDKMWIHCKNYEALNCLATIRDIDLNFFYHTNDEYVMTSKGYIFTRPGGSIGPMSIMVMPELVGCYRDYDIKNCYAVCSDYVKNIKNSIGG